VPNSNKRRKENLFREDPHCYWCGIEVINYPLADGERMPDNFATLDHLDTRLSGNRGVIKNQTRTVLACSKCNFDRGVEEVNNTPIEELRRRSGHGL